jgi:hypothetical protein
MYSFKANNPSTRKKKKGNNFLNFFFIKINHFLLVFQAWSIYIKIEKIFVN